jgi:hypothetical protein
LFARVNKKRPQKRPHETCRASAQLGERSDLLARCALGGLVKQRCSLAGSELVDIALADEIRAKHQSQLRCRHALVKHQVCAAIKQAGWHVAIKTVHLGVSQQGRMRQPAAQEDQRRKGVFRQLRADND